MMISEETSTRQKQIARLIRSITTHTEGQRKHFAACAKPLRAVHLARMVPYFSAEDLSRIRFCNMYPLYAPQLEFDSRMGTLEVQQPGCEGKNAVTYLDVIVTREPLNPALLFHELVHVVQYRLLGAERYARLSLQSLVTFGRDENPLEACADALEARFLADNSAFSVEQEVAEWLAARRFTPTALPVFKETSPYAAFAMKCADGLSALLLRSWAGGSRKPQRA